MATGLYVPIDAPLPLPPARSLLTTVQRLGRLHGTLVTSAINHTVDEFKGGEALVAALAAAEEFASVGREERATVDAVLASAGEFGPLLAAQDLADMLTAATQPGADPPDDRIFSGGLSFNDLPCSEAELAALCGDAIDDTSAVASAGVVNFDASVIRSGVSCSTMGDVTSDATREKAKAHLDVCQHARVAREFWGGASAESEPTDTPYLSNGDATSVTTGSTTGVIDALSQLEEGFAGLNAEACGCGERALIHASIRFVNIAAALGLVRVEGGLLLTASDNIVVTGPGYSGSSSSDTPPALTAAETVYGTGMVDVWLGRPVTDEGIDRGGNTRVVWAYRPFAYAYGQCCVLSATVDLTVDGRC